MVGHFNLFSERKSENFRIKVAQIRNFTKNRNLKNHDILDLNFKDLKKITISPASARYKDGQCNKDNKST